MFLPDLASQADGDSRCQSSGAEDSCREAQKPFSLQGKQPSQLGLHGREGGSYHHLLRKKIQSCFLKFLSQSRNDYFFKYIALGTDTNINVIIPQHWE